MLLPTPPHPVRLAIALLMALPLLPVPAHAVQWMRDRVELIASAWDDTATAEFTYQQPASGEISIQSVVTGCPCLAVRGTTSDPTQPRIGKLVLDFKIGSRVGRQEREVFVTTSDAPDQPKTLTVVVDIQEVVQLTSHVAIWNAGDPKDARTIRVQFREPADSALSLGTVSDPRIVARLTRQSTGAYQLVIEPPVTTERMTGSIQLRATQGARSKELTVFVATP